MAKNPKRPRDPVQLAKLIVDMATGEVDDRERTLEEQGKNPAAVALGRLGGLKGGKARAALRSSGGRCQATLPNYVGPLKKLIDKAA